MESKKENPLKRQKKDKGDDYTFTGKAREMDLENNFISKLNLASFDCLKNKERTVCEKCKSKRMYYCYECLIPIIKEGIPQMKLPVDVTV